VSFCVEDGVSGVARSGKPPVGVDRGVQVAVATSEGDLYDRVFVTPGEQQRLRRLQQCLSRSLRVRGRGRGSKRRERVRAELGRLNARIRARRGDFAAQIAHRLVAAHGMVVVEDLKVKNMTATARGTIGQPGRHVRAKAGLNRAILAKGWGGFLLAVQSAGRYHGCSVVTVDPAVHVADL
jgi:putative transposase